MAFNQLVLPLIANLWQKDMAAVTEKLIVVHKIKSKLVNLPCLQHGVIKHEWGNPDHDIIKLPSRSANSCWSSTIKRSGCRQEIGCFINTRARIVFSCRKNNSHCIIDQIG